MYKIFETFVGAGGSHIGFKKAGFHAVYVNDNDEDCIKTLIENNPELIKEKAYIDKRSILEIDSKDILKKANLKAKELDVCFGGIVCKGFSLAGERSPNDERNYFYHKQIELVSVLQPKISVIENVKGILNGKVLSKKTPINVKKEVDNLWQELENYKGQKAELRKKNKITKEFNEKGENLRKQKEEIIKKLEEKGYLISVIDDIRELYSNLNYRVDHRVVNSAWYGSATKRERVIIVAVRNDIKGEFKFPVPTHYDTTLKTKIFFDNLDLKKLKKPVTVNDALKTIDYKKNDPDNLPMNHSKKTVDRFKLIPEGESIADHLENIPDDLKISKFYSRGNTMRLNGNAPSPTLVPGHSNFPVHPREHRSITVREASVITGFPLDYKFIGSHTKRCEHVGNAVPPQLAEAIGRSCVDLLKKNK